MSLSTQSKHGRLAELILLTVYGVLVFLSDLLLEALPNVEMVSLLLFVMAYVFRLRSLVTLYVYAGLYLLTSGFYAINLGYLYVWLFLMIPATLLPRQMKPAPLTLCSTLMLTLYGFAFGFLLVPMQMLTFGLDISGGIAWWMAGIGFDTIHAVGNFAFSFLALPLIRVLSRLEQKRIAMYS